jgi:hypothetical protein
VFLKISFLFFTECITNDGILWTKKCLFFFNKMKIIVRSACSNFIKWQWDLAQKTKKFFCFVIKNSCYLFLHISNLMKNTGFCDPKDEFSFQVNKKFIVLETNTILLKINGKFSLIKNSFLHFSYTKKLLLGTKHFFKITIDF